MPGKILQNLSDHVGKVHLGNISVESLLQRSWVYIHWPTLETLHFYNLRFDRDFKDKSVSFNLKR